MSVAQYLAAGVGLVVLLWPYIPAMFRGVVMLFDSPATKVDAPNYRDAIYYLAQVRSRLSATGSLADDQKRAIDILTLALVDWSDL